jgi:hypothetical protein
MPAWANDELERIGAPSIVAHRARAATLKLVLP